MRRSSESRYDAGSGLPGCTRSASTAIASFKVEAAGRLRSQETVLAQRPVGRVAPTCDQLLLLLDRPRLRIPEAGLEARAVRVADDGDSRNHAVVAERELRRAEAGLDRIGELGAVTHEREHVVPQRAQLDHGTVAPLGDHLLELRVADDRDPREPRKDVGDVRRETALLTVE